MTDGIATSTNSAWNDRICVSPLNAARRIVQRAFRISSAEFGFRRDSAQQSRVRPPLN